MKPDSATTPIAANGVYDISIERYHNDPHVCAGPSVSSGGLRIIAAQSPLHFFAQWSGNPNAKKRDTQAMLMGRAAHAHMLGDEVFFERFAVLPYPDFRTQAARDWRDKMIAAGKGVIKESDLVQISEMGRRLSAHPVVKMGLLDGWQEVSLIWKDKETGVWLKSRPDLIAKDLMCGDYKTTADASPYGISRSLADRGLHQQAALAMEAYEHVLDMRMEHFILIFQENTPPYAVNPVLLSQDAIARGRVLNRHAIRIFADCLARNEWPGYPERTTPVDTPDWYNKQFDARQESDELPTYFDAGVRTPAPDETPRKKSKTITDPLA